MSATIEVSYSELDAYRQCPLKWQWGYRDRWTKSDRSENSPLAKGSLWHRLMQDHYSLIRRARERDGRFLENPSREWQQHVTEQLIQQALDTLSEVEDGEVRKLLAWMYGGHLEQYGLDLQWRIIAVERPGAVWLPTPTGHRSRFRLRYKMDLLIFDLETRQYKVVDHKSASNFSRPTEIDLDDQFGLYTWACRRETGIRAIAVIRSDARTQRNKGPMGLDQRFKRTQTFRSDKELANIAADAYATASEAYRSKRVAHSSPAPDRCTWRCDFLEAHLAVRKAIGDTETVLRDFKFVQREAKHQEYTPDEDSRITGGLK